VNDTRSPDVETMWTIRPLQKKASAFGALSEEDGMALFDLMKCWRRNKPWGLGKAADPEKLWHYAGLHGLGAVAGAVGLEMGDDPGKVTDQASDIYFSGMIRHERAIKVCAKIEQAAQSGGLHVVALKGPTLVGQAYGGQSARQYGDIDLFIPSQKEAWLLLEAIGAAESARLMDGSGFWSRLQNPGKIEADFDSFLLEITCLEGAPSDPMLELFHRRHDRLFGAGLLSPDPSAHFVYLLLHMLTHHLCARLIWWMDLVALHDQGSLDMPWIVEELKALELSGTAGNMSAFIQTWIDPSFPCLGKIERGRRGFLLVMMNHEVVFNRALGPQYVTPLKNGMLYMVYLVLYFLIGDKAGFAGALRSNAARWMAARYARGFGFDFRFLIKVIQWVAALLIWPLSRIVEGVLFSGKRFAMRP